MTDALLYDVYFSRDCLIGEIGLGCNSESLAAMILWYVLLQAWWILSYGDFLVPRAPLIADVIRQGYVKLCEAA